MALSANTVWEVRQTGSDTNGGGFVTGASGTDYSLQTSAQIAVTDGVANGTTTITSATASFGSTHVGNIIYVSGGTGSIAAGWYQVVSVTNSTTIVVDRSTGLTAGTGVTLNLGGALATPGKAAALATVSGMYIYVKYSASVYTLTTSTAGSAGPAVLTSVVGLTIEGYDVARGDRTGNRPTLQWQTAPGANTFAVSCGGNVRQTVLNLIVDGNSNTNASGFSTPTRCSVLDCVATNCTGTNGLGFLIGSSQAARCQANNCLTGFSANSNSNSSCVVDCEAVSCTTGFSTTTASSFINCLARSGTTGFVGVTGTAFYRCTADGNSTGFSLTGQVLAVNCLATNQSGGGGIGYSVGASLCVLNNCAVYNNATSISGTPAVNEGQVTLSADPYVARGSNDFRPNTTAGGGAALRNAGIGVFGQTDNVDIGAVRHTDPAGGLLVHVGMQGGFNG